MPSYYKPACQIKITSLLIHGPLLRRLLCQFYCILRKCWDCVICHRGWRWKINLQYNKTMQEYSLGDDVTVKSHDSPRSAPPPAQNHRPVFAECYTAVLYNNCSPSYTSDLLISWYAMVDSICQTNITSETVTPQASNIVTSWLPLPHLSSTRCCCQTFCCWNDRVI